MLRSWKLGRIAGIDVFLHPTFLILLLVVSLGGGGPLGALLLAAVFACVLLHEFGHALTARGYGIATRDITLYPIGGLARLERMPRKPGPELLIALAGPVVNLVLAAGLYGLAALLGAGVPAPGESLAVAARFAALLARINLWLALFNLIPAFPMDGGRVLRAVLSERIGRLRATEFAARVGQVLAVSFGMYCLLQGLWLQVFLAGFVFLAATAEQARVRIEEFSRRMTVPFPGPFGAQRRWEECAPGVYRPAAGATAGGAPAPPWN